MEYTVFPGLFMRRSAGNDCYFSQKDFITNVHASFNNKILGTKTSIAVIDSHRAFPYYDKNRDTIVIDTHFFDILHIVSAVMFSGNDDCMDILASKCAADYFLCKDEIYVALDYAKRFSEGKEAIEQISKKHAAKIDNVFFRQLLFVLSHEEGHALLSYDENDKRFLPFRKFYDTEYERITTDARLIHSVDISPLKNDLDQITYQRQILSLTPAIFI